MADAIVGAAQVLVSLVQQQYKDMKEAQELAEMVQRDIECYNEMIVCLDKLGNPEAKHALADVLKNIKELDLVFAKQKKSSAGGCMAFMTGKRNKNILEEGRQQYV